MTPAGGGHERIQALVEVIQAVLVSLEDRPASVAWEEVERDVRTRLGVPPVASPSAGPVAPPSSPTPARAAPGSSLQGEQLDSIELFLRGDDSGVGVGPAEPPVAPPPAPDPAPVASAPVAPGELDAAASAELTGLRERVRELEAQNAELQAAVASAPGGGPAGEAPPVAAPSAPVAAGVGPSVDRLIQALGVNNVPTGSRGDLDERLVRQLEHLAAYFDGTKRNLDHAFATLQLPVDIPEFSAEMRQALLERYELEQYLESMRDCWKTLVGGTWNSLRSWCQKVETSIDPQSIEKTAKERGEKPWAVYQDLYQYLSLYDSVIETLRANIKALVRSNNPELLG